MSGTRTLFDDLPAPPCARDRHDWEPTRYVWPGETHERLVWRCRRCGEMRGRA